MMLTMLKSKIHRATVTEADLHYVGSLIASNDTDPQRASWVFFLPARYGVPVVWNASGQALTATGTDQVLTVTPLIGSVV